MKEETTTTAYSSYILSKNAYTYHLPLHQLRVFETSIYHACKSKDERRGTARQRLPTLPPPPALPSPRDS